MSAIDPYTTIDIRDALVFAEQSKASVVPALCMIAGAHLSPEEAQVVRALSPAALRPLCVLDSPGLKRVEVATILTSAIAIQIPAEPKTAVVDASPAPTYLPRLPFPVTLFELYDEDGDHNRFAHFNMDNDVTEVIAIICAETDPGTEWLTWMMLSTFDRGDPLSTPHFGVSMLRLASDGTDVVTYIGGDHVSANMSWVPTTVAACCQLATARGAVAVPVNPGSRQQRRATERKLGWKQPRIYHLDIGGSAEPDHREGHREYTCRWLVRGHWRLLDGDTHGRKTWIRPYIKGPIGAPFRGRPTYTVRPDIVAD